MTSRTLQTAIIKSVFDHFSQRQNQNVRSTALSKGQELKRAEVVYSILKVFTTESNKNVVGGGGGNNPILVHWLGP